MANAWEQVQWIAAEGLNYLEDALVISQLASRDKTADFNVRPNGYSVGSSVDIVTNPVYEADEFSSTINIQDIRSSKRTMTIEKHFDVSVAMTAKEKRLDMANFAEQVIRPAAYALAEKLDIYVGTKILQAAGAYSSADLFASAADMALAKKEATFQQLSPTGRFCLVNDALEAKLLGATYFNTHTNRGESGERVFNEGAMGRAMGMGFFSSLNFPTTAHTAGDMVAVTDNGSGGNTNNRVGMTTLTIDTTTNGRSLEAGDRLKIAGVRRPLIVETGIADTDATTSIVLSDPITEIIPDNAAVTVAASGAAVTWQGAIMDDRSLAFASPLLDPASDKPSSVLSNNGYSLRVVQGYNQSTKTETISLDVIAGAVAYDPRRITLVGDTA